MARAVRDRIANLVLLPLILLIFSVSVGCGMLLFGRMILTRSITFLFLPFNLILAAIPILFSVMFSTAVGRRGRVAYGSLWLLFFPNAPYIITDFVHLTRIGGASGAPLWFDILLVTSYAGSGLLFGYISLRQIQRSIARENPVVGWILAAASCFLAGFGIYLGRFLRWHSVDIFLNPLSLFADITARIFDPLSHPRAWGVTFGFGALIFFGYVAVIYIGRLDARPLKKELDRSRAFLSAGGSE